jgi:hypothetical protein
MTDHARPFRHLTGAEALRALYVDFEGEKDTPPVLLGVHRRGRGARPFVQQDVLDEGFAGLAGSCLSLHDAVEKVVRRAEHGARRIVAWTEHELRVVRTLHAEDPALVARAGSGRTKWISCDAAPPSPSARPTSPAMSRGGASPSSSTNNRRAKVHGSLAVACARSNAPLSEPGKCSSQRSVTALSCAASRTTPSPYCRADVPRALRGAIGR